MLQFSRLLPCLQIGDLQLLPSSSLGRLRAYEWQAAAASLSDPLSVQELLFISMRAHLPSVGLYIEEADTPKEASPFALVISASTTSDAFHHHTKQRPSLPAGHTLLPRQGQLRLDNGVPFNKL